jgi:hypothetical protein
MLMPEPHNSYLESGELLRIGDQLTRHDRTCTVEAYKKILVPWTQQCPCGFCRNFGLQRETAYPPSFLKLLSQLGIDVGKEGEVYDLGPASVGERRYGGWFFFCGELLELGEKLRTQDGISYFVTGPGKMPSPNPRNAFGEYPLALDFTTEIPWVLDEDPEANYRPAVRN